MALFIGIDSGTQSVKAVALDAESGRVVARSRAPHRMIPGLPAGHCEQHPGEWVEAMEGALRELGAAIDRRQVAGIGISGQQHGFVPLDGKGAVIRPAKLWCDTSTQEECRILTRKLGGGRAVLRRTGMPFLPGYTAPKILWLRRREPAHFRRLRHVLLPHDYLNYHLTGRITMEAGDASGTALLDVRKRTWSAAVLEAVGIGDQLPPLQPSHAAAGVLRPELARAFGLPAEVLVSAGGGDNMMAAIGTGNVSAGVVTASLGTSGTIFARSTRPAVDPRGEVAAFCSSDGAWLPLVCTMNAAAAIDRFAALFGFDHGAVEAAVAAAPAGSGGLLILPYLEGERTPNLPGASGSILGLRPAALAPANLMRAAMEGVTCGLNYGLRRLRALGIRPKEIRLTGGGARSPVWRQMIADVFGVPVVAMAEPEGAALGAALQAAWCRERQERGGRASLATLAARAVAVEESTRCEPEMRNADCYAELQARHEAAARLPLS